MHSGEVYDCSVGAEIDLKLKVLFPLTSTSKAVAW